MPTARRRPSGRRSCACAGRGAGSGPATSTASPGDRALHRRPARRSPSSAPPRRHGVHRPQRRLRRRVHRAGAAARGPPGRSSNGCAPASSPGGSTPTASSPTASPSCAPATASRSTAHHDALADATATAAVLPHLLAAHGITTWPAASITRSGPSARGSGALGAEIAAHSRLDHLGLGPRRSSKRSSHRSLATRNAPRRHRRRSSSTSSTGYRSTTHRAAGRSRSSHRGSEPSASTRPSQGPASSRPIVELSGALDRLHAVDAERARLTRALVVRDDVPLAAVVEHPRGVSPRAR